MGPDCGFILQVPSVNNSNCFVITMTLEVINSDLTV